MSWSELARARSLDAWQAEHPFWFLVGAEVSLTKPVRSQRTEAIDLRAASSPPKPSAPAPAPTSAPPARLVRPIKKSLTTFPSMISVGRTLNNDIVIEDVRVSKFHALFRIRDQGFELEDAGSVNGTRLNSEPVHKGSPRVVRSGDRIAFGALELQIFDSAAAWAALRKGG